MTEAQPPRVTRREVLKGGVTFGAGVIFGAHFSAAIAQGQEAVWLHVHVDKHIDKEQQISTAQAWTTSDQAGKNRVPVGTLHLVLDAFRHREDRCNHCDYLRIEEIHLGPEVTKATAKAWCEGPTVGPVTKSI